MTEAEADAPIETEQTMAEFVSWMKAFNSGSPVFVGVAKNGGMWARLADGRKIRIVVDPARAKRPSKRKSP